jgi:hypothetical protein
MIRTAALNLYDQNTLINYATKYRINYWIPTWKETQIQDVELKLRVVTTKYS